MGPVGAVKLKVGLKRMATEGRGGFCKGPVWCYCTDVCHAESGRHTTYRYDTRRPIETNTFFGVGRSIKKVLSALVKVKRSRIIQEQKHAPLFLACRMKQSPQQGAAHHNFHRNLFASRSRRILRTSALASVRCSTGGEGGCCLCCDCAIGQYFVQ